MRGIVADRGALMLATLFFLGLVALARAHEAFWLIFAGLLILLTGGALFILRHDLRIRGLHVSILPLAYIVSVLLAYLLVAQGWVRVLFILAASFGFLLLMARAVEWAYPTWTWFFTSLTFFLFASGLQGLTFHLRFPVWATAAGTGLMTGLLTYHVVGRAVTTVRARLFWSVVLSLLVVETLTVFAFFPLSYTAIGGVLFVTFYLLLHLLQQYFYQRLTRALVMEYVSVAMLTIGLILSTASWRV